MSQLIFRYSEAYDAQIGGWTGALDEQFFEQHYGDWETDYVSKGKRFAADCQRAWDLINNSVFAAFREFGYQFSDEAVAYPVHPWTYFLAFKDLIEDDVHNACTVDPQGGRAVPSLGCRGRSGTGSGISIRNVRACR